MVRLLKLDLPASKVMELTGRSIGLVSRVRDEHGIAPRGRWVAASASGAALAEEPSESEGVGLGRPWIPSEGWDYTAARPRQREWLALLAAASPFELVNLRHAVCRVLRIPLGSSDWSIETAVIADRRLADDLAGLYLTARGTLR